MQGWKDSNPFIRIIGRSTAKLISRTVNLTHGNSSALLAADVFLASLSLVAVVLLRYYPQIGAEEVATLWHAVPVFAMVCIVVFPACGLYTTDWKYPTINDLFRIPRAAVVSLLALVCVMFFFTRLQGLPRLAVAAEGFVLITALAAVRIVFLFDAIRPTARAEKRAHAVARSGMVPVLLVGSSQAADRFISAMHADPRNDLLPLGLLDDNAAKQGMTVRGVPVIGPLRDAASVIDSFGRQGIAFSKLIFTEPLSAFGNREANALLDLADRRGIGVMRLPRPTELRDPRKHRFDLLPIELTELLQRPQATLDRDQVIHLVRGKRVVVTGAGGSIGSELTKQLAALGPGS